MVNPAPEGDRLSRSWQHLSSPGQQRVVVEDINSALNTPYPTRAHITSLFPSAVVGSPPAGAPLVAAAPAQV